MREREGEKRRERKHLKRNTTRVREKMRRSWWRKGILRGEREDQNGRNRLLYGLVLLLLSLSPVIHFSSHFLSIHYLFSVEPSLYAVSSTEFVLSRQWFALYPLHIWCDLMIFTHIGCICVCWGKCIYLCISPSFLVASAIQIVCSHQTRSHKKLTISNRFTKCVFIILLAWPKTIRFQQVFFPCTFYKR